MTKPTEPNPPRISIPVSGRFLALIALLPMLLCVATGPSSPVAAQDEPKTATVALAGLDGPVEISRDEWGVPTINAGTDHDLFMGFGYAMAQDRLWQMDGSRRLAQGRIAEVAGRDQLHWDIYHRTLRLGNVADRSVDMLDPSTRAYLQAFADGVNAYIENHKDTLSFEFLLMGYEPEPWDVADSLAITGLVGAWLSSDSWDEEMYANLISALGEETAADLFRPVPDNEPDYSGANTEVGDSTDPTCGKSAPCITPGASKGTLLQDAGDPRRALVARWLEPLARIASAGHLEASNIWAVDGSLTESGEPILAMDPHLNYFSPSILYEACLDGGGFHCWGATFPGMPFLPFGANDNIAWGASNLPADSEDYFVEKVNPQNSHQYEVDGAWVDFDVVRETIPYKDESGSMQDYLLDVLLSRHGPVVFQGYGEHTALKWTGIQPADNVTSFAKAMRAESIEEFYEAFRGYHSPPQNMCVAENGRQGRVGQVLIGDIPVRKGFDGTHPVDGSDSSLEWTGFIPYDDLPHRLDPPEGFVAHANNLPLGGIVGDTRPMGSSFSTNHRVNRIIQILLSQQPLNPDKMRSMQMDDLDPTAEVFVPAILASWERAGESHAGLSTYMEDLSGWDGRLSKDSIPASIYQLWIIELVQTCIMGHVPSHLAAYLAYEDRWLPLLEEYVNGASTLDWLGTDTQEIRDEKILDALDTAVQKLRQEVGSDETAWTWGDLNKAIFPHPSGMTAIIGGGTHPWGGGRYTLRVGHYTMGGALPFQNDFGAVFRSIVVSENGRWSIEAVLPPGEGGLAFGPHGSDQMDLWLTGDWRPVAFGTTSVPLSILRLQPE